MPGYIFLLEFYGSRVLSSLALFLVICLKNVLCWLVCSFSLCPHKNDIPSWKKVQLSKNRQRKLYRIWLFTRKCLILNVYDLKFMHFLVQSLILFCCIHALCAFSNCEHVFLTLNILLCHNFSSFMLFYFMDIWEFL